MIWQNQLATLSQKSLEVLVVSKIQKLGTPAMGKPSLVLQAINGC